MAQKLSPPPQRWATYGTVMSSAMGRDTERGDRQRGNTDSGRGGVNRKEARRVAEDPTGDQERRQAEERLGLRAGARGEPPRTRTGEPASGHPESLGPSRWSSGLAGHADLGFVSENPIMRRAGGPRAPENAQRSQNNTSSAGHGPGGTVRRTLRPRSVSCPPASGEAPPHPHWLKRREEHPPPGHCPAWEPTEARGGED